MKFLASDVAKQNGCGEDAGQTKRAVGSLSGSHIRDARRNALRRISAAKVKRTTIVHDNGGDDGRRRLRLQILEKEAARNEIRR